MFKQRRPSTVHSAYLRLLAAALIGTAVLLCGCADDREQITSYSQLNEPGTVIAVATDTPEAVLVSEEFPDAEIQSYTDIFPVYQEVSNGKVDAVIYARKQMELAAENGVSGVRLLDDTFSENTVAVAFSRRSSIPDLRNRFNDFLQEIRADGTLDDMYDRWVKKGEETMPDIPAVKSSKTTLCVATTGTVEPYSYYIGTELAGFDIEMAKRFAAWMGTGLEFKVYDFMGIIPATQAGDADCIMSNLYYLPEREEALDWSEPVDKVEITAMVRDKAAAKGGLMSFLSSLVNSFRKTFIYQGRWRLFLSGIGITLFITIQSIVFGTILGFAAFMACRHGNRAANTVAEFCVWLVQGMPVVVLLMILYYIVFGSLKIPGTAVAIIGFTLIFGACVYEMLKSGTSAVGIGQTEAAYSLGYTDRKTFYKVVLPQALPLIIPTYKGNITALLKATAVVGYIAVQDLTKMADIVRSRTYEAFFPLIAVAVIYFILAGLLNAVVDRIEPKLNPRMRRPEDILKGVE